MNAEWWVKILRRVAPMPHENRVAYLLSDATNRHAKILSDQGKYAGAEELFEPALELRRILLGDDHPDTAGIYANLAINLRELPVEDVRRIAERCQHLEIDVGAFGKFAPLQPLFEKVLRIRRLELGEDHPQTAESYNDAANNLERQGKYSEAQLGYEKALRIRRRLSPKNYDTAVSLNNLAATLNAQGNFAEAQPYLQEALEIFKVVLPEHYLQIALAHNNLGANLDAQGKFAAAEPHHRKALAIRLRSSDDDSNAAHSYINVAANLEYQGKFAQAQPLHEKALAILRRVSGDDEVFTSSSYHGLAINLGEQGRYVAAEPLFRRALAIRRRDRGDDDPSTAISYHSLADNLIAEGKYTEAQQLCEKALTINRQRLGDDHPKTALCYASLATLFNAQKKYADAHPFYAKALELRVSRLTDDHPDTATSYGNLAANFDAQGEYAQAQPLHETSVEIFHRTLSDDHVRTAFSYSALAYNLASQGKYHQARDRWLSAVKGLDKARLRIAFAGLERSGKVNSPRPALAAVLARLGQPRDAWQILEEDLGRGLLDELAAREDQRLTPSERDQLRELIAEFDRLDFLVAITPKDLGKGERAKRFEDLNHQRDAASIALGEFHNKLVQKYGELAGAVAELREIQAALPADAALVTWVDIPHVGPKPADPDGEHWGVVVRSHGVPSWVPINGTGSGGLWSEDDTRLVVQVRTELQKQLKDDPADVRSLFQKLRAQRLEPLAHALDAADNGVQKARSLIVLPSRAMAGIPVEALFAADDNRTVSYAPSGSVFKYLRAQAKPDRHAGLLAVGDPVYDRSIRPNDPPPPDHGLAVNSIEAGGNAATRGLKHGDVILSYNGTPLFKREDLKIVVEPGRSVPVKVWRSGKVNQIELASGKIGVEVDRRPASVAVVDAQVTAGARGGAVGLRGIHCVAPHARTRSRR